MAVRHVYGKIAGADALVFAYDTGDTRNSYRGEPTTNLVISPDGNANVITTDIPPGTNVIGYAQYSDGYFVNPRDTVNTAATGLTFTYSVWMRSRSATPSTYLMYVYTGTGPDGGWWSFGSGPLTTEWRKYTYTRSDMTGTVSQVTVYRYNQQGTIEIAAPQIEIKSHATQFVNGTRSATQGLLDLTGNYTLDISNASFDSNAFITFDGSSDYIDISNSTALFSGTQDFTVEAAYNMEGQGGGEIFGNYGSGHTTDHLWFSGMYGLWINGGVYAPGAPLANGRYHMVGTRKNGLVELYLNGELVNSGTRNASIATDINYRIGADVNGAGEPFTGDIFVVKAYNRALTAAEVRSNYNFYKSRFNL